jgi:hypothetical protein
MKKKPTEARQFDCGEMMHKAQELGAITLQGKMVEEQLDCWNGASTRLQANLEQDTQTARRKRATSRTRTRSA